MLKFDAGELAKGALQGLQKAGESAQEKGGLAGDLLGGVQKAFSGDAPAQLVSALKELIEKAREQIQGKGGNDALKACLQKAENLLDGKGKLSAEAVTKLTAELSALLKGGQKKDQEPAAKRDPSPAGAKQTAARPAGKPAPSAAAKPAKQFSDVEPGAYYYDAVQWAVSEGITAGVSETTFSPDAPCSRSQTIVLLWRAAGSPEAKSQSTPFSDVQEGSFYYDALRWAAEKKIATGDAFHPDDPVTRGMLAAFLYRANGSPAVSKPSDFTDVPSDSPYAKPVAWVAARGITAGTSETTFSPDLACTRGQIVTFLYRAK